MQFSPEVERWRSTVKKYVPKQHVDKFLYAMQGESGGDPSAVGDNGVAIGLMQIQDKTRFSNRPDKSVLLDPEENIKYAAQQLGAAKGDFSAWGENNTYEGKPFGALGNNPYPVNGRAPVTGGIKRQGPVKPPTTPVSITGAINKQLGKAGSSLKAAKSRTIKANTYTPTGDYATDMGAYWAASQKAYEELAKYQNASSDLLNVDEAAGIVYRYDPESEGLVVDEKGSAILQRALSNESAIDRLLAGKKAGLVDTGEASASAYLASEKEKAASAATSYGDYIKRVSDLAAVEEIPLQKASNLASVMKAVNEGRSRGTFNQLGAGMGSSGRPMTTDYGPIASSLRGVLPKQAPAPYSMNPKALEPNYPTPIKIPAKTPEEVLSGYGVDPSMLPGPPSDPTLQNRRISQVPPWKQSYQGLTAIQSAFSSPSRFIR